MPLPLYFLPTSNVEPQSIRRPASFNVMKLPPVDIIDEKMKNGAGVMLDDVVAAFYAWVVVSILGWLFG